MRKVLGPKEKKGLATFPVAPPYAGRLMPLAQDRMQQRLDATMFSVTTGGLTQRQIDGPVLDLDLGTLAPRSLLRYARALIARMARTGKPL